MLKKTCFALAATAVLLASCSGDDSELAAVGEAPLYVTNGTQIFSFLPSNRLAATAATITGITAGTTIIGLDMNPRQGSLAALGSNGQVYAINGVSGIAQAIGSPDTVTSFAGKAVDIDFNPRVQDVFRIVTSTGDNIRRNQASGARAGTDKAFTYITGDVNAGKTINIGALAYTDSRLNNGTIPAQTTAFVIDTANNSVALLGSSPANGTAGNPGNPNEGILTTVCALNPDITNPVGFDIDSALNRGYIVTNSTGGPSLFTINLTQTGTTPGGPTFACTFEFAGLLAPAIGTITGFAVQQQ